jgi:hypothetical protein
VPFVVPFTITLTPGNELPSSAAVILPDTTRSCAHAMLLISNKSGTNLISKFFLILFWFRFLLSTVALSGVNIMIEYNIPITLAEKPPFLFQTIAEKVALQSCHKKSPHLASSFDYCHSTFLSINCTPDFE